MTGNRRIKLTVGIAALVAIGWIGGVVFSRSEGRGEASDEIEWERVNYAPGLNLKITRPTSVSPEGGWPVVMYIHGGGWGHGGIYEHDSTFYSDELSHLGYAVVAPQYRLTAQGHVFPAQIEDLEKAHTWLVEHGAEHDLDIGRIGVVGCSAGGHLGALLALKKGVRVERGVEPGAVVAFVGISGIYSLRSIGRQLEELAQEENWDVREPNSPRSLEALLLGAPPPEAAELAAAASPTLLARRGETGRPSTLLIHGRRDKVSPAIQSEEFAEALQEAGVDADYLEGRTGHSITPLDSFFHKGRTLRAVAEFMEQQLK